MSPTMVGEPFSALQGISLTGSAVSIRSPRQERVALGEVGKRHLIICGRAVNSLQVSLLETTSI